MENNLLCGSLIFNINTEKYNNLNYVRVIYNEGSDSYIIQVLRGIEHDGMVNDFEVIDQKDREYVFGLVSSIEEMI